LNLGILLGVPLYVIDIHSHILAEVDDGAKTWEIALEMCRMAVADGIQHMVATPHANGHYPYNRDYLRTQLNHLRALVGGKPKLSLGCDFHLSPENVADALVHPELYCIEGSTYLLVELNNQSVPPQIEEYLAQFLQKKIVPIITHPERNPIIQQTPERVLQWVQMGCPVQVTASALTGFWGERAWRTAAWFLQRDAVHFLATDAHDTKYRIPILSAARLEVAHTRGADVAHALVDANPRAVVNAQPLPYCPDPIMKG
jgi:protein-tyrosine phosphatase